MTRILTIVLKIEDEKAAEAYWDAHRDNTTIGGCKVVSLANGNQIKVLNEIEKIHEGYAEGTYTDDEIGEMVLEILDNRYDQEM
jgi:hypothetical protein